MSLPFILIHGAWHGAWCWHKVVPLLMKAGHLVLVPDLPAHGEKSSPFSTISFKTYVDFIVSLVLAQDKPVVLVGHSFAGMIISQVAEQIPEKIEQLVFVAAFIAENNHSMLDEASYSKNSNPQHLIQVKSEEHAIVLNWDDSSLLKNYFYQCCSEDDFQYALKRLKKEPFQPFKERVSLTESRFGRVKKRAILTLQDHAIDIDNQRRMVKNAHIEKVMELDCDHSPFFSASNEIVKILNDCGGEG